MKLSQIIKIVVSFMVCIGLLACSKATDKDFKNAVFDFPCKENCGVEDEIKLSHGDLHATFLLPTAYHAEVINNDYVHFRMKYPSLEVVPLRAYREEDEIEVFMNFYNDPKSKVDFIKSQALDHMNPKIPDQYYRAGKQGIYELFQYSFSTKPATIFVFKAKDGNEVAVEDSGDWARTFGAERKMGANIELLYFIPKPLGKDFVHIDETVTDFISSRFNSVPA